MKESKVQVNKFAYTSNLEKSSECGHGSTIDMYITKQLSTISYFTKQ